MSNIFRPTKIEDIGSGIAERRVTINGVERIRGDILTHADLASIAVANRNAMIENRIISVYPKHVGARAFGAERASAAVEGEFHVVAKGFGKYEVIKGVVLLADATKEAAAEFVAAQSAKAAQPAQASPAGPANSRARKPRKRPKLRTRGPRQPKRPPAAPPPGSEQENGPV